LPSLRFCAGQMAPAAWGFDVNNATEFQGVWPEAVAAKHTKLEEFLLKERYDEAEDEVKTLQADAKNSNDGLVEAAAFCAQAKVYGTRNLHQEAKEAADNALSKMRALNHPQGIAAALLLCSKIALDAKDDKAAEELAKDSVAKFQASSNKPGEAAGHYMLARMHLRASEAEEAIKEIEEALKLFERAGDKEGHAATLIVKGNIYLWTYGDAQGEAARLGQEAATLCRKVSGDRAACKHREAEALYLNACASFLASKHKDGMKAAKAAAELAEKFGGPRMRASLLRAVTLGHMGLGELKEAATLSAETLEIMQSQNDEPLRAEVMAVDAMVCRQRVVKGEAELENEMVSKARGVLDIFSNLGDQHAAALHRLELAQALQLMGDASAALTEATIAFEFFKQEGLKVGQGMCMMTIAQCQHLTGDTKAAMNTAGKAEVMLAGTPASKDLKQLLDFLKTQSGSSSGIKWGKKTSEWANYDVPVLTSAPQSADHGVKRSTYSRLIKARIHTGDTPEAISFDGPSLMYQDLLLGVAFPFLRDVPPPPGMSAAPPPAAPAPAPAPARNPTTAGGAQIALPERPRPPPEPKGPVIIRSLVVGNDILGGRCRDCPEELHQKMVKLARAGAIPMTSLSQRQALERKKPTFHGSSEWREASRWGYIHPTLTVPKGCKWQRMTVGWKLNGPLPADLLV